MAVGTPPGIAGRRAPPLLPQLRPVIEGVRQGRHKHSLTWRQAAGAKGAPGTSTGRKTQ
jgi:hypothetical protein